MSAVPRWRPNSASQRNDAMCQNQTSRCELIHIPYRLSCVSLESYVQARPVSCGSRWRLSRSSDTFSSVVSADDTISSVVSADDSSAPRSQQSGLDFGYICGRLKEGHMPISHSASATIIGAWLAIGVPISASANVITDWDEKAVAVVMPAGPVGVSQQIYAAQRMMGMVHAAMFDAVNSIERRYQPYLVRLPADPATSKEAAAAAAAAAVLATIDQKTAGEMKVALASYLASIPDDGPAKADGIKLGEAVAARVLEARANDGHDAVDDYRPRTTPGVYVPTSITAASTWSKVKPFAPTTASQFRPDPPISLSSKEWATDYNEIKDYGGKTSTKRSPQQTETARFWLMVGPPAYHPFVRQLVIAKQMSVGESARLMALADRKS